MDGPLFLSKSCKASYRTMKPLEMPLSLQDTFKACMMLF
uniref:Uncharacterized protein n=1 Tax=Physcomitrium patens TaxID=3218 RepID=A0A2K1J883_PHYPA|nr:hypothetical protein PHYPA_020838 [Physcomitrium patens]